MPAAESSSARGGRSSTESTFGVFSSASTNGLVTTSKYRLAVVATALASLSSLPRVILAPHPTPIDTLTRLRAALGPACPSLYMKRDDLLSFGMGGNKVRKLQTVLAEAVAAGTDTLITCGGLQSNHCRATAAAGAALGLRVILVVNGVRQERPTSNALLDQLFGADVRYASSREERAAMMDSVAEEERAAGRRPCVIPLGASTPIGAAGFALGIQEVLVAGLRPDVIVHSTSSGGTQAGLIAGCALFGLKTRIIGISADESSTALSAVVRDIVEGMAGLLGGSHASLGADRDVVVDDRFVGEGYGIPTKGSREALTLVARHEGIVLDPVYTAKAMAGLIERIRRDSFPVGESVLFWHTGGQVGLFA
ncbi:MAG: D-cysteine desulfhydrase family protein [Acidobacteria bacterium]|nr:D-cysteine desulfhydrase family protein [Acidobacteriota bacterium]